MADEDEKAYPGAGCQPLNSTDPVQRDIDGKMFNVGKEIQTWICPVVKDISSGSHSPEFARITVIGNLQCFLHSRGPNGDQKKFASSDTTIPAAAPNTAVRLQYGSGDNDVPVSAGSGYYYFVCDVPGTGTQGKDPQSGVVTYLVNENDDED